MRTIIGRRWPAYWDHEEVADFARTDLQLIRRARDLRDALRLATRQSENACYAAQVVIVLNRAGIVVLALSIAAWAGSQVAGFKPWRMVAGFAVMALLGILLELHERPSWRPRYFWFVPAWLIGLAGLGAAFLDMGMTLAGGLAIGLGSAALLIELGWRIAHKPAGNWLAGAVGAGAVVLGFQIVGYTRPEWKHPVLYVVNAVALLIAIVCGYKVHRAQPAKPPGDPTFVRRWFVR